MAHVDFLNKRICDLREQVCLEQSYRQDIIRSAALLANALQDIYNDVGNIPEVRRRFDDVVDIVSEYSGLEDVE